MKAVKEFLRALTEVWPQDAPACHCIVLEDGKVIVYLFTGGIVQPVELTDDDLELAPGEIVEEIKAATERKND